jgi:hypothetical protein
MRSDSQAASSIASFSISARHQRVEKPAHTVTSREVVERVDDDQRDRHVEKGVAEGERGEREAGAAPHDRRSRLRCCSRWNSRIGPTSSTSRQIRHRRGERPVGVGEELVPQHLADHQRVGAAQ